MNPQPSLFDVPAISKPQPVLQFGKYKGQPFEVLLTDPGYSVWLMNSMYAKLQAEHPALLAFLVARYGNPDSTPEHNQLQNRFLDPDFCLRFALATSPRIRAVVPTLHRNLREAWARHVRERLVREQGFETRYFAGQVEQEYRVLRDAAGKLIHHGTGTLSDGAWLNPVQVSRLEFEVEGADVSFGVATEGALCYERDYDNTVDVDRMGDRASFGVEVKPLMGDDYPAVLRAMKAVRSRQLLVQDYAGVGASWDQVAKIFGLSNITAVRLEDVERIEIPEAFRRVDVHMPTPEEAAAVVDEVYAELKA